MPSHPPNEYDNEEDPCSDCTRSECTGCPNQSETDRMLGINALADVKPNLADIVENFSPAHEGGDDVDDDDDDDEEYEPVIIDVTPLKEPAKRRTPKPRPQNDPQTIKRGKGRPKKEIDTSIPKRKPGGQPGNLNAIRHGLYVEGNAIHNTNPIDRARLFDLNHAIEYLKDYIDTTYHNGKKLKNTIEINDTLRALSLASLAVTRLITSHQQMGVSYLPSDLRTSRTTSLQKIQNYYEKNAIFLDDDPDSPLTEGLNG
ncbi:MAG: hypothetical protein CVU45_03560 [Chloroflexi bacterium HGW-Chloroflexi-7]|nr:MAG: hypothetical protein CVU45_03560 [Chloroflexi bacterium HGW-Chloroflexi-7]